MSNVINEVSVRDVLCRLVMAGGVQSGCDSIERQTPLTVTIGK